ncbi:MAG: hypothetical protein AB8I08_20105 [Sandaracinaceae bacterium]
MNLDRAQGPSSRHRALLAVVLVLSGCSATMLGLSSPAPSSDAGVVDAALFDAALFDADRAADAATPAIPPGGDLGPGSRPSDRPEAEGWEEPPDLDAEDPCCTMSEPVRVADWDDGHPWFHLPPLVAWGPGYWGVLDLYLGEAGTEGMRLRRLRPDGTPIDALVVEPPVPPANFSEGFSRPSRLSWSSGRWAIAARTPGERDDARFFARFYDRDMAPSSAWLRYHDRPASLADLVPHRGAWLGLSSDERQRWATALPPGEQASRLGAGDVAGIRGAGMESRAVMLLRAPDDLHSLSITDGERERALLPLGTFGHDADVGSVRDLAIVAAWGEDVLRVQLADPFLAEISTGAVVLAERDARRRDEGETLRSVAVVGSNKHGVAAVCYGVRTGAERSEVRLALVAPDATVRGRPVVVADSEFRFNAANCSIGSDEAGFLVAWWTGRELWVRRVDVARAP